MAARMMIPVTTPSRKYEVSAAALTSLVIVDSSPCFSKNEFHLIVACCA
jgi:hypothetical protein